MHGDSLQSFLVAIIVPDFEELRKYFQTADERVAGLSDNEICNDAQVLALILESMNKLATHAKFNGLERVKKLYLSLEQFTVENDLLTPSMKLKRNVSAKHFKT